jgi:glycosyltransferase involved in cell wall biosynthesis
VPLEIVIVSGIWPPDVGGPASHGPEMGRFLARNGHKVRAVTSAGRDGPVPAGFTLRSTSRERPRPVRLLGGAAAVAAEARRADVIYAVGMYSRSSSASLLWRIPLVMKLVSDPAYERARRLGLFSGTLEDFQLRQPAPALRALKTWRVLMVSRASRVVIPSDYLARIVSGWGISANRIAVIPNPAPPVDALPSRAEARARLGVSGPTLVFAGRIVPQKNLTLAVRALRDAPPAALVIIGKGPELPVVERAVSEAGVADRVSFKGALPRESVMEWLRAADAAILPSDWENYPHAAVEALAAGTPVIATAVGGVPEIVEPEVNGLLVPPGDSAALAAAMRAVTDHATLERLRAGGNRTRGRLRGGEEVFGAIEHELVAAAGRAAAT